MPAMAQAVSKSVLLDVLIAFLLRNFTPWWPNKVLRKGREKYRKLYEKSKTQHLSRGELSPFAR
jgi:hypothetical protein